MINQTILAKYQVRLIGYNLLHIVHSLYIVESMATIVWMSIIH